MNHRFVQRLHNCNKIKEFHIKIFNTGKIEIPGIQNDNIVHKILDKLVILLKETTNIEIVYNKNNIQNVLINSNFNCGFFVNRNKLVKILKYNYNIQALYDPCSYPGIQCKFYYLSDKCKQDGICNCSISVNNKTKKCYDLTKKEKARRKSYCARSLGQLKKSSAKTRNNPNSRIRQARRRWRC